ncbi:MAG: SH3 domain-containing protein [Clostridiales bacterium]|nr:SH3 domain-containing protein [Clostridiales bacterium]
MKKRIIFGAILCILVLCASGAMARAVNMSFGTAVIDGQTADRVHLREEPREDSVSRGLYFTGTQVLYEYATAQDDWVWVVIGDEAGYINAQYLSSAADIPSKQPIGIVITTDEELDLRTLPAFNAPCLVQLFGGMQMTVLGETASGWYYAQLDDGTAGYLKSEYLQVNGEGKALVPNSINKVNIDIKNCAVTIVPADDDQIRCIYDGGVIAFEQVINGGMHAITIKSRGLSQADQSSPVMLYLPAGIYQAMYVSTTGSTLSIAAGINSVYELNAYTSFVSLAYDGGLPATYNLSLAHSQCTFGVKESVSDFAVHASRITGSSIRNGLIGALPYEPGADSYEYTTGHQSSELNVSLMEESLLEIFVVQ